MSFKAAAIIPAGGVGTRIGGAEPKQFISLAGIPLLVHTIRSVQECGAINHIIVVAPTDYLKQTKDLVKKYSLKKVKAVVAGGILRQDSVLAGLRVVDAEIDLVAVHDGARPLVSAAIIKKCLQAAKKYGAAIVALPAKDTLKEAGDNNLIARTIDRSKIWQAQTPQAAKKELLQEAFDKAEEHGFEGTDEASLLEFAGIPVHMVEGEEKNIKITRPDDIKIAETLLVNEKKGNDSSNIRIGHGYDAHQLVADRKLILGGVEINYEKGLLGHSDADVLTHALCDAILGAMGRGDIGKHFPDTDAAFKDVSSLKLLDEIVEVMQKDNMCLINADITIIAQQPKLLGYFAKMKKNLARACKVSEDRINLKGTTTEKMGFAGRQEGMSAHAVVLISDELRVTGDK